MILTLTYPIMENSILFYEDYRTPDRRVGLLARLIPSWVFGVKAALTVYKASSLAKRGLYTDAHWHESSIRIMRALESVGVHFEVTGIENIVRPETPCVFIGNHMSTLETFILPCLIGPHKKVSFVVKESLINYPVFGHIMRSRSPITVGRTNPRDDLRAVLEGGEERLRSGISIIIFPQTTRSMELDPREFNSIGVKLAKKAGVPVVPVALKTDAWTNGGIIKDFGQIIPRLKVHFRFGDPMIIKDRGNEEHQAVIEFIQSNLLNWKAEDEIHPPR